MQQPFEIGTLPAPLQEAVGERLYETAIRGLQRAAAEAEPPLLGHLLGAEAYCLFEEALEIMVDEVLERGRRSLELLTRARKAGLPAELAKAYRAKVRRLVKREEAREAKVLALLEQDPEGLDAQSAKDLAYLLDDQGGARKSALAARLWELLTVDRDSPSEADFARSRLALSLWHAGERARARPLLEALLRQEFPENYDPEGFMLLAGNCFLEEALEEGHAETILRTWRRLRAEISARSEGSFPRAIELRRRLLRVAKRLGLAEIREGLTS